MKKIVVNKNGDDVLISRTAFLRLRELGQREALLEQDIGIDSPHAAYSQDRYGARVPRDDRKLVQVVEELGFRANGYGVRLAVVEISDDAHTEIARTNDMNGASKVQTL